VAAGAATAHAVPVSIALPIKARAKRRFAGCNDGESVILIRLHH